MGFYIHAVPGLRKNRVQKNGPWTVDPGTGSRTVALGSRWQELMGYLHMATVLIQESNSSKSLIGWSWVTWPPNPHPLGQGRAGHLDWQHHQDCTSWSKAGFPKENQHATYQNGEWMLCRENQQMPTIISMALSLIGWYLQCSHNSPPLLAELLLVFCLLED